MKSHSQSMEFELPERQEPLACLNTVRRIGIAILLDKALKSLPRSLSFALHLICRGDIENGRSVARLLFEHRPKLLDGLIEHLLSKIDKTHIMVHIREDLSEVSGLLEILQGLIRLTRVVVQQSQVAVGLC